MVIEELELNFQYYYSTKRLSYILQKNSSNLNILILIYIEHNDLYMKQFF